MESFLRAVGLAPSEGTPLCEMPVASRRRPSSADRRALSLQELRDLLPDLAGVAAGTEPGILSLEDEARSLEYLAPKEALELLRRWSEDVVLREDRSSIPVGSGVPAQFLRSNALEKAFQGLRKNEAWKHEMADRPLFSADGSSPAEVFAAELRSVLQLSLPRAASQLAQPLQEVLSEPSAPPETPQAVHLCLQMQQFCCCSRGAMDVASPRESVATSSSSFRRLSSAREYFEMFVVPVQTLWLMTCIQPHEELLKAGTLIKFQEDLGHSFFISHQWAGLGHPDPHLLQLKVLQDALRNLLSGNSSISASMVMELLAGQQHGVSMHDKLADRLFVWYDYFCCPQANVAHRQSAIDSIPAYVGRCQIFCILCPHVRHANDNTLLNKHTWAERGWCRLERAARELSLHPDSIATIEIHSATHQVLSNTFDWVRCPVGEGSFSEETDRERVGEVLCDMIKAKLQHYLDEEDLHNYRLLLNTQAVHFRNLSVRSVESLLPHTCSDEQDPASFALGQFLEQNGFANAVERNDVGWMPLCYAALAGDPLVLAALLQQRANVNDGIGRQDPILQFAAGTSVLDVCVCLHHNNAARMLIDFSADVRQKDGLRATAAHWACVGNNVEGLQLLRIAGCSLGDRALFGELPFGLACAMGSVRCIKELLPVTDRQELAIGLHSALLYGHASAEVVAILVEAGADINQAAERPEFFSAFGLVCAFLSLRHHWRPSALSTYARNVAGATPLICSILSGSFEAAAVLISAGASLELSNHEGKFPRDFLNPESAPEFLVKAIGGCPAACDAAVAEHSQRIWVSV
ncbi:Ankyrin repeat domain-containing protein 17 [Symbiodinium microadriaticum]|uniref:Ankyrin repeat domain-containing protein 17 n=1 Tax=Symbiodinium microadriaticum TaxID=2951 RepID=A0A1Q9DLZ7_SYMMI|nr:Ankyrin repeat domain-containing protein 17 [Symbiodinium microadriaticum]